MKLIEWVDMPEGLLLRVGIDSGKETEGDLGTYIRSSRVSADVGFNVHENI
jgi:hypothetical protein